MTVKRIEIESLAVTSATRISRVGRVIQINLAFPDETAAELAYADFAEALRMEGGFKLGFKVPKK